MHPNMIWTIFRKDVRDAIRDSRVIAALLIPIGLGIFYNFMFDDDEFTPPPVNVAFSIQGESRLPDELAAITSGSADLNISIFDDAGEVHRLVEDEDADIGMVIPDGFDAAVAAGESPPLNLIIREEQSSGINYVLAALEETLRTMSGRAPPATITAVVIPADAGDEVSIFEEIGPRQYFVLAAIIILIGMNAMLVVPIILSEESEKKTLDALVMVASYVDVVIAKALVGLFYAAASTVALIGITRIPIENPALFTLATVLYAVSLIGFGLLIGTIFSNANQVNTWGGFFLMPVMAPAFLVGFPFSGIVDTILSLLSTSQAMRMMLNAISGEALFPNVWLSILVLFVWIAVAYGILVLRLSRREA